MHAHTRTPCIHTTTPVFTPTVREHSINPTGDKSFTEILNLIYPLLYTYFYKNIIIRTLQLKIRTMVWTCYPWNHTKIRTLQIHENRPTGLNKYMIQIHVEHKMDWLQPFCLWRPSWIYDKTLSVHIAHHDYQQYITVILTEKMAKFSFSFCSYFEILYH